MTPLLARMIWYVFLLFVGMAILLWEIVPSCPSLTLFLSELDNKGIPEQANVRGQGLRSSFWLGLHLCLHIIGKDRGVYFVCLLVSISVRVYVVYVLVRVCVCPPPPCPPPFSPSPGHRPRRGDIMKNVFGEWQMSAHW